MLFLHPRIYKPRTDTVARPRRRMLVSGVRGHKSSVRLLGLPGEQPESAAAGELPCWRWSTVQKTTLQHSWRLPQCGGLSWEILNWSIIIYRFICSGGSTDSSSLSSSCFGCSPSFPPPLPVSHANGILIWLGWL